MEQSGLKALVAGYKRRGADRIQARIVAERMIALLREEQLLSRLDLRVDNLTIEELSWVELDRRIESGSFRAMAVLDRKPAGIFAIAPELAIGALDLLLGGAAGDAPASLTDLEAGVLKGTVGAAVMSAVKNALEPALIAGYQMNLGLGEGVVDEPDPREPALGGPTIAAMAHCELAGSRGVMAVGLCRSMLPFAEARSRQDPRNLTAQGTRAEGLPNLSSIAEARMELKAVLTTRRLALSTVARLRVGSLMPIGRLDRKTPGVDLCYRGMSLYRGIIIENHGWHKFIVERKNTEYGGNNGSPASQQDA